ncbi:hypothetical protein SPI_02833 [Niveomyces insectorum RCEF 264]|uniref:Duf1770 domain containing protein n=1 Tax=Niveomyces insectorum RCEF 264 TaxID=1081102 RepID=A0A167WU19_9HYPO|nr:hypothetical protein SPI_02833 [Niveomyces insectorum RCEF 264]
MASSIPLQLAETVQTAHIRQNPSVERDLAPSTAADTKEPVVLEESHPPGPHAASQLDSTVVLEALDDETDEDDEDDDDDDEDLPYSIVRPWDEDHTSNGIRQAPRSNRHHIHPLPALPDLRFEQSYLRSLAAARTWWQVGLVTVRDQVLMPFVQGLLYNLAVCGWQYWNRSAQLSGQSTGARLRRWWYGVNNWVLPEGAVGALTAAAKTPKPRTAGGPWR